MTRVLSGDGGYATIQLEMKESRNMNTDSIEIYREERAEARACGDLDFPVYSEWLQNQCDPHAERISAEERIEMKEKWIT